MFVPAIDEATGGRLKIELFIPGEHPYMKDDMLKVLRDGTCEMAMGSGGYLAPVEPQLAAVELPMMMPGDILTAFELYDAVFDDIHKPTFDRWGAMNLFSQSFPHQRVAATVAIKDWDSLKGKKVRTWTKELTAFINMLNGTGVTIAFAEVPTALATGLIQGAISNSDSLYRLGVFDHAKVLNLLELQFGFVYCLVSKEAFAELPPDLQKIVVEVSGGMRDASIEYNFGAADAAVLKAVKELGVTATAWSDEFRAEVVERAATDVWDVWAEGAGPEGKAALAIVAKAKAALDLK